MPADLNLIEHRPYPLPLGRPAMAMNWHDLLFAHWPVPIKKLAELVPRRLSLDIFDGKAWVGVVPFSMSGVRLLPLPGMPGATKFPEINVRTYVSESGIPGVYFFSLDAASLLAVKAARAWYHLPYYHAKIVAGRTGETISYRSIRIAPPHAHAPEFEGSYRPISPASCGGCGSLAHWLTERYCLYTLSRRGHLYRADIHHAMWPLQLAEAELRENSMTAPLGLTLPNTAPLLHFAKRLDVVAWKPVRIAVN